MVKIDDLIKALENWLKSPDNSQVKLASALGYTSSNAIYNWLRRKRIPQNRRDQLKNFLNSQKKGKKV